MTEFVKMLDGEEILERQRVEAAQDAALTMVIAAKMVEVLTFLQNSPGLDSEAIGQLCKITDTAASDYCAALQRAGLVREA